MSGKCPGALYAYRDKAVSHGGSAASGIADGTFLSYILVVNSDEFIRKVRRAGRKRGMGT